MADVQLPRTATVVRALRRARHLSQEQLAELAGVKRVEILAVEKGRNKVTSARMRDGLSRALQLPADVLARLLTGELSIEEIAPAQHVA